MLLSRVIDMSFIKRVTANTLLCMVPSMSLSRFQRAFALRMAHRVLTLMVLIVENALVT